MKTNEVTTAKRKSNHSFLFVGLAALCIVIQIIMYTFLDPIEPEGLKNFQLIILSVVNPIAALIRTLIATIMHFI